MGQCCSSDSHVRNGGGVAAQSPTPAPIATAASPSDLNYTQKQQKQSQQQQQEEYPQEYVSKQDDSARIREMNSFMINSSTDEASNSMDDVHAATKRANEVGDHHNRQDGSNSMPMKSSEENSLESSILSSPAHLGYNNTRSQVPGATESDAGFLTARSLLETPSHNNSNSNININYNYYNRPYRFPSGNSYTYQRHTSLGIDSEPFPASSEPIPASEAFISCRSSYYIPSSITSARDQPQTVLVGGGISPRPYLLPRPLLINNNNNNYNNYNNNPTSTTASERAFHSCHSLYTLTSLSPQPSGRQHIHIPQTGSFSRTNTRTSITQPILSARPGVVSNAVMQRNRRATAPATTSITTTATTSITTTTSSARGRVGGGKEGIIPKLNMIEVVKGGGLPQRYIHTPESSLTLQEQKYSSFDGRDISLEESALFHSFATASDDYVLGDTPLQSLLTTTTTITNNNHQQQQQEEEGDLLLLSDASPPPPQSQSPLPPPQLQQILAQQARQEKQKTLLSSQQQQQLLLSPQPSSSHFSHASLATSGVPRSQRKSSNSGVTTGSLTSSSPSSTMDEKKLTTTKTQRKVTVSKGNGNEAIHSVKKPLQPVSNTLQPSQSTATSFAQSDSLSSSKSIPKGNTDTLAKRQGSHKKIMGTRKLSKQEENRREVKEKEEEKEEEENDREYSRIDPHQSLVPLIEEENNVDERKNENGESEGGFDTVVSNETCNPEGTVMLSSIGSKTVSKWSLIRSDPSEGGQVGQKQFLPTASVQEEYTPQYDNKEKEKNNRNNRNKNNKKKETLMQEQEEEEEFPEDEENRKVNESFLIREDNEGEEEELLANKDNDIVGDSFLIREEDGEEEEDDEPVEDKDNKNVDESFLLQEEDGEEEGEAEDDYANKVDNQKSDDDKEEEGIEEEEDEKEEEYYVDEADNQQNEDDKEEEMLEEEEKKEEEQEQQEQQEHQESSGENDAKENEEEKERNVFSYQTDSSCSNSRNLSPAKSLTNLNNEEILTGDSLILLTNDILGNEKEGNMNINSHCNSNTSNNSINNKDDVIAKMNGDKANVSINSKANNTSTDTRGETSTNEQNENDEKLVLLV